MKRINVLLIYEEKEEETKSYYVWITNFNRLLFDQTKHNKRKYPYERCLHIFSRENLLKLHIL